MKQFPGNDAGEGSKKAYYTIKYATKPQQDIESPWALHLHAFDKANERISRTPMTLLCLDVDGFSQCAVL
ncbi:hypothetical protein PC121_g4985 [Phytophthora cactorum]|nr:hypothetical protein PC121_g4985 [Phytophthora cactorum]KAG4062127.1 hypothetical protein PC123_g3014 [Phytophthora cactorum]